MQHHSHVCVTPRRSTAEPWFLPKILKVQVDGCIHIENESNKVVTVMKNEHYADVRSCQETSLEAFAMDVNASNVYAIEDDNTSIYDDEPVPESVTGLYRPRQPTSSDMETKI